MPARSNSVLNRSLILLGLFGVPTAALALEPDDSFISVNESVDYNDYRFGGPINAGDVDGDGDDELVVTDSNVPAEMYLYAGEPTGVDTSSPVEMILDAGITDARLFAVDAAGDLNGDGFDDLTFSDANTPENLYVFYGSASGIVTSSYDTVAPSDGAVSDNFGRNVLAIDLNADGYGDLVVSAHRDDDGADSSGSIYVYLGSASGISSSHAQKLASPVASRNWWYGFNLAPLGDLDGDGYPDLIVSTANTGDTAYIHYGAAGGIDETRNDTISRPSSTAYAWGEDFVSTDVDGDGVAELFSGASSSNGGAGGLWVHTNTGGSFDAGVEISPSDLTAAEPKWGEELLDVGDFDGDGYNDLAVSHGGSWALGAVSILFGSASGLDTENRVVYDYPGADTGPRFGGAMALQDFNGDGAGDLIVSATHENGQRGAVYVIHGAGSSAPVDSDGDGVADDMDACPGFDDGLDLDLDGVPDGCDACDGDDASGDGDGDFICDDSDLCPTDPDNLDADGDLVCDIEDLCQGDNSYGDADGDQICEDIDLCEGNDATGDTDSDAVCDANDNCPNDANSDQSDADGDEIGDVCEADTDADGTIDDDDNCPADANPDQGDSDGDGAGDVCDLDDDDDGIADTSDNCPLDANADQADFDGDGDGDICDGDDDADGVSDEDDLCPGTPLDVTFDPGTGCSGTQYVDMLVGDRSDYPNKGQYVSAVTQAANAAMKAGLLTGKEKAAIVRAAAKGE